MIWAGVDEAGRGALAGPVVAAAVILPEGFSHPWLRDSKLLTPAQREKVFASLQRAGALIGIGMQGPNAIDHYNILRATLLAMQEAVEALAVRPDAVRIDGKYVPPLPIPTYACIKGDQLYPEIAAASIAAKVIRDQLMSLLHKDFPAYGWAVNKGYPTLAHRKVLSQLGPSPLHRRSFLKGIL
ncbi:MAG: ribonuclease HII [Bacteroidia bacterium]|nr:ribonuclease HII [Bacteroidia bacterium]MDW8235598.1 ribonuclease HII [Bacteroidia bacterium]